MRYQSAIWSRLSQWLDLEVDNDEKCTSFTSLLYQKGLLTCIGDLAQINLLKLLNFTEPLLDSDHHHSIPIEVTDFIVRQLDYICSQDSSLGYSFLLSMRSPTNIMSTNNMDYSNVILSPLSRPSSYDVLDLLSLQKSLCETLRSCSESSPSLNSMDYDKQLISIARKNGCFKLAHSILSKLEPSVINSFSYVMEKANLSLDEGNLKDSYSILCNFLGPGFSRLAEISNETHMAELIRTVSSVYRNRFKVANGFSNQGISFDNSIPIEVEEENNYLHHFLSKSINYVPANEDIWIQSAKFYNSQFDSILNEVLNCHHSVPIVTPPFHSSAHNLLKQLRDMVITSRGEIPSDFSKVTEENEEKK